MEKAKLRTIFAAFAVMILGLGASYTPSLLSKPEKENLVIAGKLGPEPEILANMYLSLIHISHLLAVEYLRNGNPSTAFNLGSSTGFSNLQIVEAARKVTGHPIPLEIADRRPGDPDTLIASSKKARAILGWQPKRCV